MSKLIETNEQSYRDIFLEDAAAAGVNGRRLGFSLMMDSTSFCLRFGRQL